jgi:phage baseplate assembly protein W
MPQQKTYARLGSDIALTRYTGVPGSLTLESADSWGTVDLAVVPGGKGGLKAVGDVSDLGAVSGRANLAQALIVRLLTPLGSLAPLGHPEYGSRLVELVGQVNNVATRNLARLYTIQALSQEPRAREILDLTVDTPEGQTDTVRIGFSVLPLDDDAPLPLALEVTL